MAARLLPPDAPSEATAPRFRSVSPWLAELRNASCASAPTQTEHGVFAWQQPGHDWVARHRIDIASPGGLHALWLESLQDFSSFFSGPFPDWPAEQWNALVEMALAPVLSCIGHALGAPVHVVQVGSTPLTEIRRHQAAAVPRLEFALRRHGAAHDIAGALEVSASQSYVFHPSSRPDIAPWNGLAVPLALRLGSTRLGLRDLAGLHAGAAVRMDAPMRSGVIVGSLCLARRGALARAELRDDGLHIRDLVPTAQHGSLHMNTPSRDAADAASSSTNVELPLDALEVELVFESGELSLSIAELARLRSGSVISLGHRVADHVVTVRVNGQIVGRGEFIELGDELAVRLTQWRARGASA